MVVSSCFFKLKTIEIMIRCFTFCFMLLLGGFSFAQDFDVEIGITHVTCSEQGMFAFSAEDLDENPIADADMQYLIYDLPDENLIATVTGENSYSDLAPGEYKVVAVHNGDFVGAITYEPLLVEDLCLEVQ